MENKIVTVSIIGCGSRGGNAYGNPMYQAKDRFRIVSICDLNRERLAHYGDAWGIAPCDRFAEDEAFFARKRSDILVIATQDRDHVWMCIRAFELGYTVLLEKPISSERNELRALLAAEKKYGGKALVCHVLRYAPAYLKIKSLIENGAIGRMILIESIEQVGYWHQAHSFVRGNWRNADVTSSMLMQKCCHDLDLIQYYIGAKCETVYSTGDLTFFAAENKPNGAAERCADCRYMTSCPYSAERLYIERWNKDGKPENSWPYNVVCEDVPNTEDKLRSAYTQNMYGRCVFACDNDVADHQTVSMRFASGVKAQLVMTAFTAEMGRRMTFHGTLGELRYFEDEGIIVVLPFGGDKTVIRTCDLVTADMENSFGHGGGDCKLLDALYDMAVYGNDAPTSLESSMESHLIALAAEQSRKENTVVRVNEERL